MINYQQITARAIAAKLNAVQILSFLDAIQTAEKQYHEPPRTPIEAEAGTMIGLAMLFQNGQIKVKAKGNDVDRWEWGASEKIAPTSPES